MEASVDQITTIQTRQKDRQQDPVQKVCKTRIEAEKTASEHDHAATYQPHSPELLPAPYQESGFR